MNLVKQRSTVEFMRGMSEAPQKSNRPLVRTLTVFFLMALILGPGPGSTLIDGTAEDPNFLFGVPALYAWVVFWYVVMAGCVVVAARKLWRDED